MHTEHEPEAASVEAAERSQPPWIERDDREPARENTGSSGSPCPCGRFVSGRDNSGLDEKVGDSPTLSISPVSRNDTARQNIHEGHSMPNRPSGSLLRDLDHTRSFGGTPSATQSLARLFSPREVAAMLGCTEWWLREQVRLLRFPHVRLAKAKIMFAQAHIERIVAQLSVHAPVHAPDGEVERIDALASLATTRSAALHRHQNAR